MSLAPIILFVYNRVEHFQRTYDALARCPEAAASDLFIFSDGPKDEIGAKKVSELRQVLRKIAPGQAFKSITINESAENRGLAASVIAGVTEVLEKHGRAIVLEDDCLASPHFLRFMNSCLDYYEQDSAIGAIAGYSPAISFPDDYQHDIFLAYRSCSWGWATWHNRWQNIDWQLLGMAAFYRHPALLRQLNANGSDRFLRLYRQSKGNGSSWSVRFGAHLVKNNWFTVYPRYSYIQNIGCDASGVHSKAEDAESMWVDLNKALPTPRIITVPLRQEIQTALKRHYSGGWFSGCKRFLATKAIVLKECIKFKAKCQATINQL
jgi:hypothetical protein